MRPWDNLSDYEFENLVGDLLAQDLGVRLERFTAGRDGGIDLRHTPAAGGASDIVQAKHYKASTYANLRAAVRGEARRLAALDPQPRSYRLVTSLGLTPANKTELADILRVWIGRDDHVIGRDDLESLLDAHPAVERRHIKLWLATGSQLDALIRAGTHARSRALANDIRRAIPLYVQGQSFIDAQERLNDGHSLLIAGPPGIGKTTLARMLIADAIAQGYEPIEVSRSIDEAWDIWDSEVRQILLYDDFLGRTVLGELAKNEDSRLLSFMAEVARSARTLFVLTTREYILREAHSASEAFRRHGLERNRFLLRLESYSPLDRAKILHNHVWHSNLLPAAKVELAVDRGYRRIVDHQNFNPRIIEYITGLQPGNPVEIGPGNSWLDFAQRALNHPEEIWRQAFERELGEPERALLRCLVTLPDEAEIDDLASAYDKWAEGLRLPRGTAHFEDALRTVDDTFTTTRRRQGGTIFVAVANPGLTDFVQRQLLDDPALMQVAVECAAFFEQLQRLWRLLGPRIGDADESVQSLPFAESAARVYDANGARWILTVSGTGTESFRRHNLTSDGRLHWVVVVATSTACPDGFHEFAETLLASRVREWRSANGDPQSAPQLASSLNDFPGASPDDWRAALANMATSDPVMTAEWDAVADLIEILPEEFPSDRREELGNRFASFAYDELHYNEDGLDTSEALYELEGVADRFGIELDEADLEVARERISQREDREDELEPRRSVFDGPRLGGSLSDREEMDAMFGRDVPQAP